MYFCASIFLKEVSKVNPLWEERIVLVDALSEEEALCKAEILGKKASHSYKASSGELVEWKFECVERIFLFEDDNIQDGAELFSRFLRDSEAKSILIPFDDE